MKAHSLISRFKAWRQNQPFLVIALLIALQIIVFYILYWTPYIEHHVLDPIVNFYASVSSKALNVLGYQTNVIADTIYSARFNVSIRKGCDALEPMALITAGIVAFPSSRRQKLIGLPLGIVFLFLLNIVRIITLYLTGVYKPGLFEMMHVEVWQILFIIMGIGYWFVWVRLAVGKVQPT